MASKPDPSGWTLDTLHAHLSTILAERDQRYGQRFADLETALRAALAASEKAIGKAEIANERRFDSVNEFRQTLGDQAAQFATRAEVEAAIGRNTERIQDLTDRVNQSEGKGAGLNAGWAILVGAVVLIGAIVTIYLALRAH